MAAAAAALAAAADAAAPSAAMASMRADDARVLRMGRTVAAGDGALRFGYPGVTLTVEFEGTRLAADLAGGAGSLLDVRVDGGTPFTLRPGTRRRSVALVEHAAPGRHRVELLHRTETWLGVVTVARFATDGRFHAPPPLPARSMLVLGDSVTCGADMERGPGDKNDPSWWNAGASYGMLLGHALGARVQLVCHGGRGLLRSWNGNTDEYQLPAFYELAIADAAAPAPWQQADDRADLILVAIGTNDFNQGIPEREAWVGAYAAFVRRLLRDHPQAQVALTEGAILDGEKKAALTAYLRETVERVADARVHAIPSLHHPGDAQDAHPTTPQHAAMARELAPHLRRLAGW
ncbi:xylan esterase [Massilia forsythiae]|uniref:Xylan esterase n=2 Tax=Massilia forsythiae TaxID=2728020 RepID=A0A7Z2W1U1_9BURK|nr:xylan esterase [Massilia forsythiae]